MFYLTNCFSTILLIFYLKICFENGILWSILWYKDIIIIPDLCFYPDEKYNASKPQIHVIFDIDESWIFEIILSNYCYYSKVSSEASAVGFLVSKYA